jgi:hypothetical protein
MNFFISAGTPATIVFEGTSFVTTAPAATTLFSPILILGIIVALAPIVTKDSIMQFPVILTPGEISTKSPNIQSWLILALIFIMHPLQT